MCVKLTSLWLLVQHIPAAESLPLLGRGEHLQGGDRGTEQHQNPQHPFTRALLTCSRVKREKKQTHPAARSEGRPGGAGGGRQLRGEGVRHRELTGTGTEQRAAQGWRPTPTPALGRHKPVPGSALPGAELVPGWGQSPARPGRSSGIPRCPLAPCRQAQLTGFS